MTSGPEPERTCRDAAATPGNNGRDAELAATAARASTGDQDALGRMLARLRGPIVVYCRARAGRGTGTMTSEQVAEEVLRAVCAARPSRTAADTTFLAFVHRIARHTMDDALRAAAQDRDERTRAIPAAGEDGATPVERPTGVSSGAWMRSLLEQLPPSERDVLVLRVAMHCSADDTARVVGSTSAGIRALQHRALSNLRCLLANRAPAGPVGP